MTTRSHRVLYCDGRECLDGTCEQCTRGYCSRWDCERCTFIRQRLAVREAPSLQRDDDGSPTTRRGDRQP